jgi:hypothetical protein
MNILLGFAPYIAFFLFMRTVSSDAGLWAALVVAVLIGARNWARSGSLKILEAGTVLIFLVLVIFTAAEHWKWTVIAVRLAVDAGLLAIVLVSLAIGRPFTLQYARERVAEQYWHTPLFLTINRGITFAWAAALSSGAGRQALTDPKGRLILSPACGRRIFGWWVFDGLRGWW